MGRVALIIRTTAQPGRRGDIFAAYRDLMAPRAEANEAQELVVWCDEAGDPDRFTLFEIYRDEAALGDNAEAHWFAEYMTRVGPLLAGEPEVIMASPQWSTGLEDSPHDLTAR